MNTTRRFLLASSLARLIEKERGGHRVTEGHFPDRSDRSTYVRVEEGAASLILVTHGPGAPVEEATELPRAHAEALLDLAAGGVDYLRINLSIGMGEARVSRFIAPGPLDLISVEFEQDEPARIFHPLPWFGPEVTAEPGFQTRSIALIGLASVPEVELTDTALNSLLNTLDNRAASRRPRTLAKEHAAPRLPVPSARAEPAPSAESEDAEDLGIEDSVIRELARSLRPQGR
jgi:CYTH domain-containing protein